MTVVSTFLKFKSWPSHYRHRFLVHIEYGHRACTRYVILRYIKTHHSLGERRKGRKRAVEEESVNRFSIHTIATVIMMAATGSSIRRITLGRTYSTVEEVIRLLQNLTPQEKIHLIFFCYGDDGYILNTTLLELIPEKYNNIHNFEVLNIQHNDLNLFCRVFDCFVQFVQENNGETKHFGYHTSGKEPMQLERAYRLAYAIQSNSNNTHGHIESFSLRSSFVIGAFQLVLNALLDSGVPDLTLGGGIFNNIDDIDNDNIINFTGISKNTSLKRLKFYSGYHRNRKINLKNLFGSIQGNTTLEILHTVLGSEALSFIEMLRVNISLTDVEFDGIELGLDGTMLLLNLKKEISIQTKINLIWKRLNIMKREEKATAATPTLTSKNKNENNVAVVGDDDIEKEQKQQQQQHAGEENKKKKIEEGKKMLKKKKEMSLWLTLFTKPLMRNELLYQFLTEHADMYNVR